MEKQPTWRQLKSMTKKEFLEFASNFIAERGRAPGIAVRFPYDLRGSLPMKVEDADPDTSWTVFISNSGKLAHLIAPEAELLVRLEFPYGVKHLSENFQRKTVENKVRRFVRL